MSTRLLGNSIRTFLWKRPLARRSCAAVRLLMVVATTCCLAFAQLQYRGHHSLTQQQPINPKLPTIFVVGDSTANNRANGALGWGDPFINYFDAARVNVVNRARAGRSSRT